MLSSVCVRVGDWILADLCENFGDALFCTFCFSICIYSLCIYIIEI